MSMWDHRSSASDAKERRVAENLRHLDAVTLLVDLHARGLDDLIATYRKHVTPKPFSSEKALIEAVERLASDLSDARERASR